MTLKLKSRRWAWLLLLLLVLGLVTWLFLRTPRLRLVEQYPFKQPVAEPVTVLPRGFLLWDTGTGGEGITAIFRDWTGRERWRVNRTDDTSVFLTDIAPGGRDFTWVDANLGEQPAVTIWRDGRVIQRRKIGVPGEQCTWVEVRDDRTAWIATSTEYILRLYAVRSDRVLRGEVRLPRILPGGTEPVTYQGAFEIQVPACVLAPNAATLQVAACADAGISATAFYPAFLTYRLRTTGNRLDLHLVARNTTLVEYMTEKWDDKGLLLTRRNYHITTPSGAPWTIQEEGAGGYYSECDQTPDGRYAMVARIKTGYPGTGPVRKLWQFVSRWLPEKAWKTYLSLDLYERPGVIRAHTALALPKASNHTLDFHAVRLAPDGRAALVTVSDKVYLFTH